MPVDPVELGVVELRRKVVLDQLRLRFLLLGQLRTATVAKLHRGLQSPLALAPQHGELILTALLGRLLKL